MNITDLPNTSGSISNGLQLARQMARAVGQVQVYADSIGAIPPNRAALINLFTAANTFLTALDLKVRLFTATIADSTLTVAQVAATSYSATLYNNTVVTTGRTITRTSSNPAVASVSGVNVTGVAAGSAVITVTDVASGRTVDIAVTVA
jgi:hypothetical protein